MSVILTRVEALRAAMNKVNVEAYIIPSSDPHQSEYVAEKWLSREWISNFNGSAGTALVTEDHAGLWTDSRYFLQAETQLAETPFELHKMENQFSESYTQWLCKHLKPGDTVGVDGFTFSISQIKHFESKLKEQGITLKTDLDLIAEVWTDDRPALPKSPIFEHESPYVDLSTANKIGAIMAESKTDYVLLSALDDIVWTLNMRGHDVDFNPVFYAYLLLSADQSVLCIDEDKVSAEIAEKLLVNGVVTKSYDAVHSLLHSISSDHTVSVDPSICSHSLAQSIGGKQAHQVSAARSLKAIKTDKEIAHIRHAMLKDAAAMTKAWMWLEEQVPSDDVTEYDFAMKLAECRAEQEAYYGESFPAIIGYRGNGAIIHYRPMPDTAATIKASGVLLCDSGGQYYDGTTDITRTVAMGDDVSDDAKQAYTAVLKGMIALDVMKFPEGTLGGQLDAFARQFLWNQGLNYLHGTGHGVGYFLNVHEPPQGFAAGPSTRSNSELKPGMITSNEPGYYKQDSFGIRLENCIVTKQSDYEGFLEHESLTLFPIDTAMMIREQMTTAEIDWLNTYHQTVLDKVSPLLQANEVEWLTKKCASL